MKPMTFDEIHAMPAGTIFRQASESPRWGAGLWAKGESNDAGPGMFRGFGLENLLGDAPAPEYIPEGSIEEGRVFLAYEPADLGRLHEAIGRAREVAR